MTKQVMTKQIVTAALAVTVLFTLVKAQAPPQAPQGAPPAAPAKPARVVPPARIEDFKVQPESVDAGKPVTLVWATENPNSVTIDPAVGRVTPRGSMQITPRSTTTYTLTVTGPNNTTLTKTVTVKVNGSVSGNAPVETAAVIHRMPDGKPDLTGVYGAGGGGLGRGRGAAPGAPGGRGGGGRGAAPAGPELKPGMDKYRVVRPANDPGPLSDCMPIAGPAAYTVPYQFQIIQNQNYVVIFHEYPGVFRIVPINGVHPVDPDPTWMGDAVGKWDGDTFVVDMVGFNDKTELSGFKHSEGLHIVERFSRPTYDTLQYEATLEDPNVFVKPWTVTRTFSLRSDLVKVDEFVCENNRNYSDLFEKKK